MRRSDRTVPKVGRFVAAMLHAVLISNFSFAEVTPPRGVVDSRVRSAPYDENQVYRIHGYVGYQIDVEFEPGEAFVGLGAGDLDGLAYFGEDNHLFLKPRAAKVATNLTVLTNRRRYQFDYSSSPDRPAIDGIDVTFALRFVYPSVPAQSDAERIAQQIDTALLEAPARRPRNIDYWYCGRPELKPTAASDDGVHTRLKFAANADLPTLFVQNADGSESLLNFSMDDGDVIIHRVARRFILRRGRLAGCIVNQGFSGSGLRLDTGTIAPDVQRQIAGSAR